MGLSSMALLLFFLPVVQAPVIPVTAKQVVGEDTVLVTVVVV